MKPPSTGNPSVDAALHSGAPLSRPIGVACKHRCEMCDVLAVVREFVAAIDALNSLPPWCLQDEYEKRFIEVCVRRNRAEAALREIAK